MNRGRRLRNIAVVAGVATLAMPGCLGGESTIGSQMNSFGRDGPWDGWEQEISLQCGPPSPGMDWGSADVNDCTGPAFASFTGEILGGRLIAKVEAGSAVVWSQARGADDPPVRGAPIGEAGSYTIHITGTRDFDGFVTVTVRCPTDQVDGGHGHA